MIGIIAGDRQRWASFEMLDEHLTSSALRRRECHHLAVRRNRREFLEPDHARHRAERDEGAGGEGDSSLRSDERAERCRRRESNETGAYEDRHVAGAFDGHPVRRFPSPAAGCRDGRAGPGSSETALQVVSRGSGGRCVRVQQSRGRSVGAPLVRRAGWR